MARTEKSKGAKHWYTYGKALSKSQKIRLFEDLLGFDFEEENDRAIADKVSWQLEFYLGSYSGLQQSIDKAPTDAVYRNEVSGLRKQAYNLLDELGSSSYWMMDLYKEFGHDLYEVQHALAKFVDVSTRIMSAKDGESRGRPTSKALTVLVNTLYQVFEQNYKIEKIDENDEIENDDHDRRKKSGRQQALEMFVTECLKLVEIKCPSNVLGLIYTSETPENERMYINRIG